MALSSTVTEDMDGRSSRLNEDGTRTAERRFNIKFDLSAATSEERDELDSYAEGALPVALYDAHPAWPAAIARSCVVAPAGVHDVWKGTVSYSSAPFPALGDGTGGEAGGTGGGPESPSNAASNNTPADQRPPEIRIRRKEYTEPLEADLVTGDPVKNTAGDPFDPPIMVDRSRRQFEITFWRTPAGLDWATRSNCWDKVNDDVVTLLGQPYAAKTLRVMDISHEAVWDKGDGGSLAFFWKITVVLEAKLPSWQIKILNAGRRERISGGDPKIVPIIDASTGQPVTDPVPLAASGARLPVDDDYHYLFFDGYETCDLPSVFA